MIIQETKVIELGQSQIHVAVNNTNKWFKRKEELNGSYERRNIYGYQGGPNLH